MRHRTCAIQIRVTEKEKQHVIRNAHRCGLSVSTYLRKLSLGKEIQSAPPLAFYRVYAQLTQLQQEYPNLSSASIAERLKTISQALMQACCNTERGDDPQCP